MSFASTIGLSSRARRRALGHRDVEIEIGQRRVALRHEALARHVQHGRDDALIGDVAGADLAVDHHAARGGKIEHRRIPESGADDAISIGKAGDNCKAPQRAPDRRGRIAPCVAAAG